MNRPQTNWVERLHVLAPTSTSDVAFHYTRLDCCLHKQPQGLGERCRQRLEPEPDVGFWCLKRQVTIVFIQQKEEKRSSQQSMSKELLSCLGGLTLIHADCSAFCLSQRTARTSEDDGRRAGLQQHCARSGVLEVFPSSFRRVTQTARTWSGSRALSKVGCDVWRAEDPHARATRRATQSAGFAWSGGRTVSKVG